MAGRGEYQKQVATLVAAAKAENLKFEDIPTKEMLEHFQDMKELKAARELIQDYEVREKELQTANETLTKKLHKKQEDIDDVPALEVDLQQAQHQIKLYKEVAEDSRERAERYQRQLQDIAFKQQADVSAANKIEDLQTELKNQQALIAKLVKENRAAEATFAQLRELDSKALAKMDKQLAKKDKELAEKDKLLARLRQAIVEHGGDDDACSLVSYDAETIVGDSEDDLFALQENIDLHERNFELETLVHDLQEQITAAKSQLGQMCSSPAQARTITLKDRNTQLLAATVSELKPLNRIYESMFLITNTYAKILQATSTDDFPPLEYIQILLNDALLETDDYIELNKVMRANFKELGVDDTQTALHQELDALAKSAKEIRLNLQIINEGVWGFLHQLSDDPKMLSGLNGALCDAPRMHIIDLNLCD